MPMHVTVSRTIFVPDIVPPRCRRPRGSHLVFPVRCAVPEYDPALLRAVAETRTHHCDGVHTATLCHHPETGFLTRLETPPSQLAALLGDRPRPDALPARDLAGLALTEIAEATRETRARAAQLAVIGEALFEQAGEPVYLVQYQPSINWDSLSLTIRSAPTLDEAASGTSDRNSDPLPRLARLFNARQRLEAVGLLRAIATAIHARRADDDRSLLEQTDQIIVLVPEVFTFDSGRWHAARETAYTRHHLSRLLDDLATPFPDATISALLYPERLAMAARLRTALGPGPLADALDQGSAPRTTAVSAE